MAPRKISNAALTQTCNDAIKVLKSDISNRRWMISTVLPVGNFGPDQIEARKARDREIVIQFDQIEKSTRTIRDMEHAIAALDEEKDNEQA